MLPPSSPSPIDDDPQPGTPAEEITIGEFLSKADPNTTYRLTGTVKNISNTLYGNFDLVDETGSVYIYGLLDKDGNAQKFESIGIKEGDTVTLEGKYKDYNGKAEIANAQYISQAWNLPCRTRFCRTFRFTPWEP